MKKKFPDISLRKFQNSMRNTFPLMRLLGSQEVVRAHTPNWQKPFPLSSGALSQTPSVFPDLLRLSQIPRVFPTWKIRNSFSRFSLISRVAGSWEPRLAILVLDLDH